MRQYAYVPASVTFPRSFCPPNHLYLVIRYKGDAGDLTYNEWCVPACRCGWRSKTRHDKVHVAFVDYLVNHLALVIEQESMFDQDAIDKLRCAFGTTR